MNHRQTIQSLTFITLVAKAWSYCQRKAIRFQKIILDNKVFYHEIIHEICCQRRRQPHPHQDLTQMFVLSSGTDTRR
ncbi:hypothetical protein QWZ16_20075 [Vibrio ostreicida]|uniref:Secreted protein n=1 Tax=Vibrio ostreicida TaxID=526588 RepID=A0ABT8BYZ3_9VIBR|nr:hypothetical protein [Vibrio ostreicida]MDN3611893.1 hypothetical protein [Vibrio ostreicida]